MAAAARQRLLNEYKGFSKEKWVNIKLDKDNIFKWSISLIVVNPESVFDGAYLKAEMGFTDKYPYAPPTFKFLQPIYHPNIYPDGKVCISILHAAGEDEQSGELACERWSSIQSVESVLRSILLLLDDPEITSPANVDASVMYRDDRAAYRERASETVRISQKSIPEGFIMPKTLSDAPPPQTIDDDEFWNESDDQDKFGVSDSSGEDNSDFEIDDEDENV
ncbi:Ubiquitin-conjugating enzyme E2-34 kDa [Golovinomyces cichoracearum]|uniref:Ubiquitin-conjugating enzyme E2 2 n=1 Tax=Golovinomyces cichoracearum TaxID=62708 RepID=A0A420J5Y5_9PEZI|nr:Ubiquitin-conjugating enzyme E2-34 kDa [Golovinomyces cichoracearum]